jgi:hypothetical protein
MAIQLDGAIPTSPYRGLEPFDERDAPFFFGRDREIRLIVASLFASPLTLLYGASGVGKSSVLRAGVLPRLRDRADLLPVVFPTFLNDASQPALRGWQSDPLGGIKETVAGALYRSAGEDAILRDRVRDAVLARKMDPLREFLAECHKASGRRLMLILDQFEEYALYHPEDDDFGRQFPSAIVPGELSVSFLISLREDSLAKLDRFKGRIPTLWDTYRRIDHLDFASAEDAVRLPLREYNNRQPGSPPICIEDALVSEVLSQVQTGSVQFESTGSGALQLPDSAEGRIETPYLQLVMMRLWERELNEGSRILRLGTLQSEEGAAAIVRTHLDRVMEQFTAEERDVAARVFHRLVTPSGAKIAFSVTDLATYENIDPKLLGPVLTRLEEGSRRILRRVASRADVAEEPRYEIFHDRLGKAILSWRAKRLQEQEREKRQREEAEQKRLAGQSRASVRGRIDAAMDQLEPDAQTTWARMMFYLVSTDGKRHTQTAGDLAELSQQPREAVELLLKRLTEFRIVRSAYGSTSSPEPSYEVGDDTTSGALLEWHSQYVANRTRTATVSAVVVREAAELVFSNLESQRSREFPYRMVRERLQKGAVIPFLGAGASFSASPAVPSGREVKELLARACDFPASAFEQSDVAEVASFFVQRLGREELDGLLHEILARKDSAPGPAHRLLAQAAKESPLIILTTNYDTLMEQALDAVEARYDTVAYMRASGPEKRELAVVPYGAASPNTIRPARFFPSQDRTLLYRLNGPAIVQGIRTGSYAITEEDNIDWIVNFEATLPMFVRLALLESPLLSLGHSARDWTQRALLRTLYGLRTSRVMPSWAVAQHPAPLSVMTWQRYGVEVYNLDLNDWSTRMRDNGPA